VHVPLELPVPVGEQHGWPAPPHVLQVYVTGETAVPATQVLSGAEQNRYP